MYIERIEIEGGFLDGLDLRLSQGLNVLIGARGTGKTSIIELIRYAVDAPVLRDHLKATIRKHAESVLGDGRVTVTLDVAGTKLHMSRSASDSNTIFASLPEPILILAQNEIEGMAIDALSRLRLLDSFIPEKDLITDRSSLRSVEATLTSLRKEIAELDEQIASYSPAAQELIQARNEQKVLLERSGELQMQEQKLRDQNKAAQERSKMLEHGTRFVKSLAEWSSNLRALADSVPTPTGLSNEYFGSVASINNSLKDVKKRLDDALTEAEILASNTKTAIKSIEKQQSESEAEARPIRSKLESSQRGAGELARRIAALEKRVAQAEAIAEQRQQRTARYEDARKQRSALLDAIEGQSSRRTLARDKAAQQLSKHLKPGVRLEIAQKANLTEYTSAVAGALRGTGMHASDLAAQISSRISPRQLVELVEAGDRSSVAKIIQISVERAQRLINALAPSSSSALLDVDVEDDVRISLLSGPDYKPISELSTGQRCTAVLPILLSRPNGCLIVDQPEDHLDNAYIVETLIAAVRERAENLQIIFSTHNPNIPVLGDANLVIELASDGVHGYPRVADVLDSDSAVKAITTVMEGGRDAFARRAAFYASHPAG